ncbi:MAG: hypothetical protein LBG12_12870 [Synergistaceae bacterium]|nr:hypothetical protein [Synergistaceae bacterium]
MNENKEGKDIVKKKAAPAPFRRKGFLSAALLSLAVMVLLSFAGAAGAAQEDLYVEGEALVLLKHRTVTAPSETHDYAQGVASQAGASVVTTYDALSSLADGVITHMKSPGSTTQALIARLKQDANVISATPNYIVHAHVKPDDPDYRDGELWGMDKINAPRAWNVTKGSEEYFVAVLDSGITEGRRPGGEFGDARLQQKLHHGPV